MSFKNIFLNEVKFAMKKRIDEISDREIAKIQKNRGLDTGKREFIPLQVESQFPHRLKSLIRGATPDVQKKLLYYNVKTMYGDKQSSISIGKALGFLISMIQKLRDVYGVSDLMDLHMDDFSEAEEKLSKFGKINWVSLETDEDTIRELVDLKRNFDTESFSSSEESPYVIVISDKPIDIARMSDHSGISSCHSEGGSEWKSCLAEAAGGGDVIYLITKDDYDMLKKRNMLDDDEIFQDRSRGVFGSSPPIARMRARLLEDSETGIQFRIPYDKTYGNQKTGFENQVYEIYRKINATSFKKFLSYHGLDESDTIELYEFRQLGGEYHDSVDWVKTFEKNFPGYKFYGEPEVVKHKEQGLQVGDIDAEALYEAWDSLRYNFEKSIQERVGSSIHVEFDDGSEIEIEPIDSNHFDIWWNFKIYINTEPYLELANNERDYYMDGQNEEDENRYFHMRDVESMKSFYPSVTEELLLTEFDVLEYSEEDTKIIFAPDKPIIVFKGALNIIYDERDDDRTPEELMAYWMRNMVSYFGSPLNDLYDALIQDELFIFE